MNPLNSMTVWVREEYVMTAARGPSGEMIKCLASDPTKFFSMSYCGKVTPVEESIRNMMSAS